MTTKSLPRIAEEYGASRHRWYHWHCWAANSVGQRDAPKHPNMFTFASFLQKMGLTRKMIWIYLNRPCYEDSLSLNSEYIRSTLFLFSTKIFSIKSALRIKVLLVLTNSSWKIGNLAQNDKHMTNLANSAMHFETYFRIARATRTNCNIEICHGEKIVMVSYAYA